MAISDQLLLKANSKSYGVYIQIWHIIFLIYVQISLIMSKFNLI